MPGRVDEEKWEKAKMLVRKQYPELSEEDERFWRLVQGVYKKLVGSRE